MPNIPNLQSVLTSGATLTNDNEVLVKTGKQLIVHCEQGAGFGVIADNENAFYSIVAIGNQLTIQAAKDGHACTLIASPNGFSIEQDGVSKNVALESGVSGSFISQDGKTITVTNGIITGITIM